MQWQLATGILDLQHPALMGILNLTPDSFSDGGSFLAPADALEQARLLIQQGAQLLDLGAESTRPEAQPVSPDEQLRRLMPVLEGLTDSPVPLSIDTSAPKVIRQVAQHPRVGAINDVKALQDPQALEEVAATKLGLCLMHMQGTPQTMQLKPDYGDVVAEVEEFLLTRARLCVQGGIAPGRICLDPGFGFGKTLEHNLRLFHSLGRFAALGYPLLVGVSRKRMLGSLLGDDKADRTLASALTSALAARRGAHLLRVHDIEATAQALRLIHQLES